MSIWPGDKSRDEEIARAKEAKAKAEADLAATKQATEAEAERAAEQRRLDEQIRADEEARLAQIEQDAEAARRERAVQMKADDLAAAKADVKAAKSGDDEQPKATRSRKRGERDFQSMLDDGWTGITIKAGETRSRLIGYDPATHRLEVADEKFGEVGAEWEGDAPEMRLEERENGGELVMDEALDRDVMAMYRPLPEIRK